MDKRHDLLPGFSRSSSPQPLLSRSRKNPIGDIWWVRLERDEKKVWLTQGWGKLIKHNSIKFGYFLVFKYTGISNFVVRILDLMATEIPYPLDDGSPDDDESSDEDSIVHGIKGGKGKTDEGCEIKTENLNISASAKLVFDKNQMAKKHNKVAEKDLPENPSFTVKLRTYNSKLLSVPAAFFPQALIKRLLSSTREVELYDSDGKKWPVTLQQRMV